MSFGGKRWVKTTHADKFRPLASFSTGWFGFSNTTPDNMACEMDGCKDEAPSGCESGGDISCADGQNMIFQMNRGDVNILCEYIMCIYGLYMYVLCMYYVSLAHLIPVFVYVHQGTPCQGLTFTAYPRKGRFGQVVSLGFRLRTYFRSWGQLRCTSKYSYTGGWLGQ